MNTEVQKYNVCQEALALKTNIEGAYLRLGELLSKIRAERLYEPQHDTFQEFLMEMDLNEGTASKMISVYDTLVKKYELSQEFILRPDPNNAQIVGWSKSWEILKVSKNEEEAVEWLKRAQIASRSHLIQDIKERATGVSMDDCKHEYRTLKICKLCNHKYEEYENNN